MSKSGHFGQHWGLINQADDAIIGLDRHAKESKRDTIVGKKSIQKIPQDEFAPINWIKGSFPFQKRKLNRLLNHSNKNLNKANM